RLSCEPAPASASEVGHLSRRRRYRSLPRGDCPPIEKGKLTNTEARTALVNASIWRSAWRWMRLRPAGVARYIVGVAALTGGYYLAAQVGYALQFPGSIAAIWPPVGLAVAVLYLGGLRWWPGIVIGDLLASEGGSPLATELVIAA